MMMSVEQAEKMVDDIRYGNLEDVCRSFADEALDVNAVLPEEVAMPAKTLLMLVSEIADADCLQPMLTTLLEQGADPNFSNPYGKQAMHYLAERDAPKEAMQVMVKHGAEVDAVAMDGCTPLHYAAMRNREAAVEFLLDVGADSRLKDGEEQDAAGYLAKQENEAGAKRAAENAVPPRLDSEAQVDREVLIQRNADGVCALDSAATWLNAGRWMPALNAAGGHLTHEDVVTVGKDGKTPAVRAFENGAGEALTIHLIEHGYGFQPQDLVDKQGNATALLQEAVQQNQVKALFSPEAWLPHGREAMQRAYHALPEAAREQVPYYHALSVELGGARRAEAGIGR